MDAVALERAFTATHGSARAAFSIGVAVLVHAGLVAAAVGVPPAPPVPAAVTEVALLPPTPEPPAAPHELQQPEPEPSAPAAAPSRARASRAPKSAEAPARAGALRTTDEAARPSDAPVRFVTDENGKSFGYGSVARGGTGDAATMAPPPSEAIRGAPAGRGNAPVLSRPPHLSESEPCRGFFPARAQVDRGEVMLRIRVERDGAVRSVSVASESPPGHGFGFAARDCLRSKRFAPALDVRGAPVAVVSPVTVRFSR